MTDYFIADPHFGHHSVLKFTLDSKLRKFFIKLFAKIGIKIKSIPLRTFASLEEHNMFIINNINKVVGPNDKLFMLGDIVFGKDNFKYLDMIKCKNRYLVAGNHDCYASKAYLQYFHKIYGVKAYERRVILSHIPVHTQQLRHRFNINVHGHMHGHRLRDPRFISVSCEQINYTPISYEQIQEIVNKIKPIHIFVGMIRDFVKI